MPGPYSWPADGNNFAPRLAVTWDPTGSAQTVVRAAYGLYYDPIITATAGITRYISGTADAVRTFVLPAPNSRFAAWATPGRRLPEVRQPCSSPVASYPSVAITIDPGPAKSRTRTRHSSASITCWRRGSAVGGFRLRPRVQAARDDRLQPGAGRSRTGPAPGGRQRPGEYLRIRAPVHLVWRDLVPRADDVARLARSGDTFFYRVGYTLSKAEDTSTDFQSAFLPQNNGRGRDPAQPTGPADRLRSARRTRPGVA